jgi:hypothetical protein
VTFGLRVLTLGTAAALTWWGFHRLPHPVAAAYFIAAAVNAGLFFRGDG